MERNARKALGRIIKSARKSRKLTQDILGELVNLGQRHIMSIENEEKGTSFESLYAIIRVLGIDANLIFYHDKEAETEDTTAGRLSRLLVQCDERELQIITALGETILRERGKTKTE